MKISSTMAYYFKINDSKDILPPYKGFHLQKVKELKTLGPNINYDFTKHVLIELLDDVTPESKLWDQMGLTGDKNIVHKRMMIDSHRIKCRRAIIICINPDEAKKLAQRLSQTKIMNRCICAVVVQDLLSDLCLFERQIIQFGDNRSQHQLVYVSDLSRSRGPSALAQFLKEKFSPFGTILSILVCSDDGDYAYPEGVIKFAYLSEAFAAELALDQFVVGKERLSVTAHHNIVLSECDLRIRLRDAQLSCSPDNNESSMSYFHLCNRSCKLNHSDTMNHSTENSFSGLHIPYVNNLKDRNVDSICDALEDTLPVFSQYNCYKVSSNTEHNKTVTHTKEATVVENSTNNVLLMNDDDYCSNSSVQQSDKYASETIPSEDVKTRGKIQKQNAKSRKNIAIDSLLSNDKACKNESDSGSFVTCDSLDPHSNVLCLSPKKSSYKSFNSQQNNSILEVQSLLSSYKHLSSLHEENICETEAFNECLPKQSKKRKKIFTSSQKLCLKSQRSGISHDSVLDTDSQVSEPSSFGTQNSQKCKKKVRKHLDFDVTIDSKSARSPQSSKVAEWLSHLPIAGSEIEELASKSKTNHTNLKLSESQKVADSILYLPKTNSKLSKIEVLLPDLPIVSKGEKLSPKKKVVLHSKNIYVEKKELGRSRISIHGTPALKQTAVITSSYEIHYADNDSIENENPNIMTLISSSDQSDCIPLTDEYNSPLQMWLKQELISSVNNPVFESKEASKSVIVCATKTGNDFITVGCSHMSCDTCYPESTDLLLGYS